MSRMSQFPRRGRTQENCENRQDLLRPEWWFFECMKVQTHNKLFVYSFQYSCQNIKFNKKILKNIFVFQQKSRTIEYFENSKYSTFSVLTIEFEMSKRTPIT